MKPIVWKRMVDGLRRRFSAGCAAGCASVAVCLASALLAAAQESDAPAQTNDVTAAEVLSQLSEMVQGDDSVQREDVAPSNSLPQASSVPQATGTGPSGDRTGRVNRFDNPGRFQKDDRRSRGRKNSRSSSGQSGGYGSANDFGRGSMDSLARTNDGSITLDYAAFKVIVDRNIFDPNRVPRRGPGPRTPPKSFDSLTLVGTMSYAKGTFAFFDGTSAEYKKALRLADAIAGYKVASISPNSVKLASGTNQFELSVGSALRREEDGPWRPASQFSSYVPTSALTSTNGTTATAAGSDTAAAGAESDIIKRLMQKREKE